MYTYSSYLRLSVAAVIAAASFPVGAADKQTADTALEEVTVTGSRVITDDVKSPTPITSIEMDEVSKTTPSDIADALNKLPQILGGRTPRNQGNGANNNGGNVLALRNFGASRTLVLLDGHRVPVSNQDGTVNVDILPDMLVKNVDIVTGGASAVYGSDAVAGVVNYVLDKNFTGFKFKADTGISKYGDGQEGQIGFAWGKELFDGKGHFETSARYRAQAEIPISSRPYGQNGQAWLQGGTGTAADPYVDVPYGRVIAQPMYGNVNCGSACAYNGYTFNQPGELSPLVHGKIISGKESGGDGGYVKYGTFRSGIEMKNWFGRFSYDFNDNVKGYAEVTWAEARNNSNWVNTVVSSSSSRPNTLFADNPYLTLATQQQLGSGITCPTAGWRCLPATPVASPQTNSTPPPPPTTPYFSAPSYIWNNVGGEGVGNTNRMYKTESVQKNTNAEVGLTGSLLGLDWDVFYSNGDSRLTVTNPNNTSNAKYLASLDAVLAPVGARVNNTTGIYDPSYVANTPNTTSIAGTVVCWVSLQPQYAGLYPGCVPTNITNPNGPSVGSYEYLRDRTAWTLSQKLDNIGASIGGGLWGLGLPAGEIRANLSFDARWATYKMESNALPTDFVNCTGLRMCLANGSAPVLWVQNTNAQVDTKNNVYEAAFEVNVPLLKDLPLVEEFSTDWAGRYTKYSTFSAVESWKGGLDWHVNSSLRFRSTLSADIRAPNLNDLYQPASISSSGFTDKLTNFASNTRLITSGNANLTPEKARTFTLGVVLTPSFLPNFNLSLDYFTTKMTDAITQINYQATNIQDLCIASAPSYNSPFCTLATRPITNSTDPAYTTSANYPTETYNSPLNAASQKTHGFDAQFNYGWEMLSGKFNLRHLLSYQPINETINLPGTAPSLAVAPKLRQTTFLSYQNGDWTWSLQNQWLSSLRLNSSAVTPTNQNYAVASLPAYDVLDVTVSKKLESWAGAEVFLTINNLNNTRAPLFTGGTAGIPGLFYPTLGFYDDMGRFFTIGIKAGF